MEIKKSPQQMSVARGQGLEGGAMVFKEIPETLNLTVTASETMVEVIPFELEVSVGF
jgi:hypothetical protein